MRHGGGPVRRDRSGASVSALRGPVFAPVPEGAEDIDADAPDADEPDPQTELSELRIRQFIALRRSAYRTRSYLIVGTAGCVFAAIQLVIFFAQFFHHRHRWWRLIETTYLFLAACAVMGAVKLGKWTWKVHREIEADLRRARNAGCQAAENEPDLSTLSDGSHHARNLERMLGDPPDEM